MHPAGKAHLTTGILPRTGARARPRLGRSRARRDRTVASHGPGARRDGPRRRGPSAAAEGVGRSARTRPSSGATRPRRGARTRSWPRRRRRSCRTRPRRSGRAGCGSCRTRPVQRSRSERLRLAQVDGRAPRRGRRRERPGVPSTDVRRARPRRRARGRRIIGTRQPVARATAPGEPGARAAVTGAQNVWLLSAR